MKKQDIYNFWNKLNISNNIINKIILKITDLQKNQLFLVDEIDDKYIWELEWMFARLVSWEPIEYILENAEFYGLDFFVDNRCLVPRDDTEVMVDKALEIEWEYSLIDVWTWSSCIPISVLKNSNNINWCFVVDISEKALEISKTNIIKHNLVDNISQINWNLLSYFLENNNIINNNNLIITANLPYIKDNDFDNMDEETVEFEPDLALYWWKETWFELYEELIKQCFKLQSIYSINKLILFIEIGFDQKEYSKKYLSELWLKFEYFKDNWWVYRCIKIEF